MRKLLRTFIGLCLLGSPISLFAQEQQEDSLSQPVKLQDSLELSQMTLLPDTENLLEASDTLTKPLLVVDERFTPPLTAKQIGMYSAIIPGVGQILNKQYWKLPIIYLGAGVAAYFIYDNRKNYNDFRSVYIGRISNQPEAFQRHPELPNLNQIQNAMNYYKHYLDLTVVFSVAGYALQVIDAVVFANLKDFDISEDISMKVEPVLYPYGGAGVGLVFKLK